MEPIKNQLSITSVTKQLLVNMAIYCDRGVWIRHQSIKIFLLFPYGSTLFPSFYQEMVSDSHHQITKLTMNLHRLIIEVFDFFRADLL